jgi:hypothetical protein
MVQGCRRGDKVEKSKLEENLAYLITPYFSRRIRQFRRSHVPVAGIIIQSHDIPVELVVNLDRRPVDRRSLGLPVVKKLEVGARYDCPVRSLVEDLEDDEK